MEPFYLDSIKNLINGLAAFITREKNIRALFSEHYTIRSLTDMMLVLLDFGVENLVVTQLMHLFNKIES